MSNPLKASGCHRPPASKGKEAPHSVGGLPPRGARSHSYTTSSSLSRLRVIGRRVGEGGFMSIFFS